MMPRITARVTEVKTTELARPNHGMPGARREEIMIQIEAFGSPADVLAFRELFKGLETACAYSGLQILHFLNRHSAACPECTLEGLEISSKPSPMEPDL